MNKSKNKNKFIKYKLLILLIFSFYAWFNYSIASDDSITNIANQDDETEEKIEELNKKAKIYKEIIEIKQKQQETLNNQLSIMDTNIEKIQNQIELKEEEINKLGDQISKIEKQIIDKDRSIEMQKIMLTNLMQEYYETSKANLAVIYLSQSNLEEYIIKKDRISQTGDKINEMVKNLNKLREELKTQNIQLGDKKNNLTNAHNELQGENITLESSKKQKANLLSQTKGEEAQYKKLLAKIEEQKQELLDIDQFFSSSGLSLDSFPKPNSDLYASVDWYYSQRDSRWGEKTIGNTKTLMKNYGCAVTSVSMVNKKNKGNDDPGDLAKESIFSGDLIKWDISLWDNAKIKLASSYGHGNINWSTIDSEIKKDNPVIIYIKKTNGTGGHYVVVHHKDSKTGKYVVHDPYFGPNIFLDTSRSLIGSMGLNSSTILDQMIIYTKK